MAKAALPSKVLGSQKRCYDKAVSTSRGERGLCTASTGSRVKLRVSGCSRGLGHARGLGSENTLWITQEVELGC